MDATSLFADLVLINNTVENTIINGNILGKDYRGNLYFDPDILIHYFYTNRLNHLWIKSSEGYTGIFGLPRKRNCNNIAFAL